jgi:hypothetical protein
MKPMCILCLALVLSGGLAVVRADMGHATSETGRFAEYKYPGLTRLPVRWQSGGWRRMARMHPPSV